MERERDQKCAVKRINKRNEKRIEKRFKKMIEKRNGKGIKNVKKKRIKKRNGKGIGNVPRKGSKNGTIRGHKCLRKIIKNETGKGPKKRSEKK